MAAQVFLKVADAHPHPPPHSASLRGTRLPPGEGGLSLSPEGRGPG
jgi:hypothetical protein